MSGLYLQRIIVSGFILVINYIACAQNLAPNPSFEIFTTCPENFSSGGPLQAIPWVNPTEATSDYFNACASTWTVGVPINLFGNEPAHTGIAYAGSFYKSPTQIYREYIQAPLTEPLIAGQYYHVSWWVSLSETHCGTSEFGAYLSVNPPSSDDYLPFAVDPQVEYQLGFILEYNGWTKIEGCFEALGGEAFITIGNFSSEGETPLDPDCTNFSGTSYYYIDDIKVELGPPPGTIDFDLGGPIVECYSYEIDPSLSNVGYYWSNGSTGPTLVVTETGTYTLTVTDGCASGTDEIEVTILGSAPVEIGTAEAQLCQGDSYEISLNPDAGSYEWQDGSNDSDYTITTGGLYQVTLDDGCELSTDEILIEIIQAPDPFTLGEDTSICPGDVIQFSFDPTLGDFEWQDNSGSPDYTISGPGTYILTISNMCGEVIDDIEVNQLDVPVVSLGPDEVTLCEDESYEIELDPELGDYSWQDGSDMPDYSIYSPGLYSVTVTNECGTSSDNIEVIYISLPTLDLGEDSVLCPSQLPVVLDAGNDPTLTFLWQDGSSESEYTVTEEGYYSVTISNGCSEADDVIRILTVDDTPVVALPADQVLCENQTFTLNAGFIEGDYVWNNGSTADTFLVTMPGTYSLTVSNDCGFGADTIVVVYRQDLISPDLGPDLVLCPGENFVLFENVSGVNYTWQNGSHADSLIVNSAGPYWLEIADICSDAADTINITIDDNPPVLDLPISISLCENGIDTIDAGISGVSYLWSDGSQLSSLIVGSPGLYSLTVSNACGNDADTVDVISGGLAPIVELGSDVSICNGDLITLSPVASNVNSWLWSDGSTASTFTITQDGVVSVLVSNDCGDFTDEINVSLLPDIPSIDLGADTSLCPGESFSISINITDVDILWSDGSTLPNLQVASPGLIYATINNNCGSASDSILVNALPQIPDLNLGIDQSLCPGEVIILSPEIDDVEYLWSNGSIANTFNATTAGEIILTISNECGFVSDTILIVENTNGPQVNIGPDILACEGDVIILSSDISGVDFLWQDGSTLPELTTTTSGTFILAVSNSCGQDKDTVEVNISGIVPTPDLGPDTLLCDGEILQLVSQADAMTSIQWQNGSSQPVFNVTAPGEFILNESNHCGDESDTISVSFLLPPPIVNLGPDQTLCPGEAVTLSAPVTTATITWHDGSHASTFLADQSQVYSLALTNECGTTSDDFELTIDQRSPLISLNDEYSWCPKDVFLVNVTQAFQASYLWNDGSILPSIQITEPGLYSVMVSTDCKSAEHDLEVIQSDTCISKNDVYVPNVFSPNADDQNDFFEVVFGPELDVTSVRCSIFDRWGNLVYGTNTGPIRWDGALGEKEMNQAVFTYVIYLDYIDRGVERSRVITGDVTLIR